MKRTSIICALLSLALAAFAAKTETITSPDGNIKMTVTAGKQLTLSVSRGEELILKDCPLSLEVATPSGEQTGDAQWSIVSRRRTRIDEVVRPVVPLKQAELRNRANQLTMTFRGGIRLDLRAYDNGMAYRFAIDIEKGKRKTDNSAAQNNLQSSIFNPQSSISGFIPICILPCGWRR